MNKTIDEQKKLVIEIAKLNHLSDLATENLLLTLDICFLEGQADELRHQLKKLCTK